MRKLFNPTNETVKWDVPGQKAEIAPQSEAVVDNFCAEVMLKNLEFLEDRGEVEAPATEEETPVSQPEPEVEPTPEVEEAPVEEPTPETPVEEAVAEEATVEPTPEVTE